jgi:nitroreductase
VTSHAATAPAAPGSTTFDTVAEVIYARRTHMLVDPDRQVPVELVHDLCNLAVWAPNHKQTWPWRFAMFTGQGRARLGEAFVADMVAAGVGDEVRQAKTLTKYLRTPAILVAGSSHHDDPMLHAENRDAVAAGVQNLLLGATARGLASFWSSPPLADAPRAVDVCGFEPATSLIAVIYLGWPRETVPTPDRPPVSLQVVDR